MKGSAGKAGKILIIVENLPVPFDRRVWQEACTLRDAGYQVSVISPIGKGYQERHQVLDGIHIFRHPLPLEGSGAIGYLFEYSAALFWEFVLAWRVLFRRGFDVIHACNPPDNIFLIALFFKLFGKKFIFDHHDINPELYEAKFGRRDFFYKVMLAWERWTFRTADVSIATNESYRRIAIERGGMPPEKVFVVRSGPNLDRMRIMPPDDTLKKGRRYLVGYVGVMGKQEGIDYLLRALHYMVHELGRTDTHFGLVGGGTELETMRAYAAELEVSEYVTFTGRVPDDEMLAMLNTADVCVNPDVANEMNDKSTMNKVMEYMALGKPIVQFDLTEGRFSAQDASLYAKKNDECDLAGKIVELLDNHEKRREMGAFGRKRVELELAWDYEIPKLLAAYEAIRHKRSSDAVKKKTTVLLTGPSLEAVSGVSTHLRLILDSNLKESFDIIHFQVGSQGRSENGVQKFLRLFSSPFKLAFTVWKHKPSLVHLNPSMDLKSFWRDSLYVLVVKLMRRRIIYQVHGGEMPEAFCSKPQYTLILKKILSYADEIVLLGDYAVTAYQDFSPGLPLNKIPNAIDCKQCEPLAPKQLNKHGFTLGYMGRLSETKGIIETLEAIALLKQENIYKKIMFKIAGSGPAEDLIRRRIEMLGIEDRAVLTGPIFGEKKADFWKEIDLFVFPTYHKEGLPYSVLESLASGTPMITTREGGIPELIKEGAHGLFVEPGEPGKIAEAVKRIYGEGEEKYASMSRACIDLAKSRYGIERLEKEFFILYSKVAAMHSGGEMELAKH